MSPEIIALVAVIGTTVSGILTTLFASRCSKIRCWGIECDREVKHSKEEMEMELEKEKMELEHNIQN